MRTAPRYVLVAAVLVAAMGYHWYRTWPYTHATEHDFDAIYLYFPLAKLLLANGIAFFADERSLQAPPFSFIYPIFFGLDLPTLRVANALISGVTLLLIARAAWALHSLVAGMCVAALFALSPLMRPFLATPITEPPYLLLCATWAWALAEWWRSRDVCYVAVSAAAIVLAALTRATIFYWAVALAVVFAAAWRFGPREHRGAAGRAALAYAIALAIPLGLIVKNLLLFKFGFYATGAGNALYLGNNPVTGGYDAPLVGLLFDQGSVARDQSQLTLEAERLLGGVARFMIGQLEPHVLAAMYVQKIGAFLFVDGAQRGVASLRSWRIGLIVLSGFGALAVRRPVRLVVVGLLAYQVAVHTPVLYSHRYSVGALDLWLVLLAGIGVASLIVPLSSRRIALAAVSIVVGVQIGRWTLDAFDPPQPNVSSAPRIRMWEEKAPRTYEANNTAAPMRYRVEHSRLPFDKYMNYVLLMDIDRPPPAARCGHLHLQYRRDGDGGGSTYEWDLGRRFGSSRVEVGRERLGLWDDGVLTLAMKCGTPTPLEIRRMEIYSPVGGIAFRERYLHEKPLFPGLVER